jgi:5'(3')-deoxyribonucleotidase
MRRKSIAIDMDGVIADVETQFINWYERELGVKVLKEDLIGRTEADAFPDATAVRRFVFTPGFFRTLPVMPDAIESVKKLMRDYDVYIVSAAMEFPQSLAEKYEWLKEHFPFISWKNIIFCGDKSVINTDYMIDDHCKNLDTCKGKAIMFNAFHNVSYTHHQRVNNWREIVEMLQPEAIAEQNNIEAP